MSKEFSIKRTNLSKIKRLKEQLKKLTADTPAAEEPKESTPTPTTPTTATADTAEEAEGATAKPKTKGKGKSEVVVWVPTKGGKKGANPKRWARTRKGRRAKPSLRSRS